MLIVETIAKIRRAFFVQGKPIKAICRELRVSRKVVRKVIRSEATEFRYEREFDPNAVGVDPNHAQSLTSRRERRQDHVPLKRPGLALEIGAGRIAKLFQTYGTDGAVNRALREALFGVHFGSGTNSRANLRTLRAKADQFKCSSKDA